MPGETDLETILAGLTVSRRPGTYVFVTRPSGEAPEPRAEVLVREGEGTTVIVTREVATARGWHGDPEMAWLTLDVHTSLEAVGVTAAVSRVLAEASIPCNVVAGFHHDHLFVPVHQADAAVECIGSLRPGSAGDARNDG